jgi:hypothetical protein
MLFISTANLVSLLALASTLTGLVLAIGPRPQCIGMELHQYQSSQPGELTSCALFWFITLAEKYKVP